MTRRTICVASGDGSGAEILEVVLALLERVRVPLELRFVDLEARGAADDAAPGIGSAALEAIESAGVLLCGPIARGRAGAPSPLETTARCRWGAFANKRLFQTFPGVPSPASRLGKDVDIVLVREVGEDAYGGVEHLATHDVALCRRIVTRPGALRVHRYAFELARRNRRKRVTCCHKADAMSVTDGLFLTTFRQVARDYPEIEASDALADDVAVQLLTAPEDLDVLVLPGVPGEILGNVCAGLVGGVGLVPSATIGEHVAVFAATQGPSPERGEGLTNPSALVRSAAMMLRHLGFHAHGAALDAALVEVLASGARTADLREPHRPVLTTRELGAAIAAAVQPPDRVPEPLAILPLTVVRQPQLIRTLNLQGEELGGADYLVESDLLPVALAQKLRAHALPGYRLTSLSNRGAVVWPHGSPFVNCVDAYSARFESEGPARVGDILRIADAISEDVRLCSVDVLLRVGGRSAFSAARR